MSSIPSDAGAPPQTGPDRRLRILVADDEPAIAKALRLLLQRRGHQVHVAADAYEALDILQGQSFDAVLVDAKMPGGGDSVLDHLKSTGFGGLKVLMTGALAADTSVQHVDVRRLQKPFSFLSVVPFLEENCAG